jgi:hypothetical protein
MTSTLERTALSPRGVISFQYRSSRTAPAAPSFIHLPFAFIARWAADRDRKKKKNPPHRAVLFPYQRFILFVVPVAFTVAALNRHAFKFISRRTETKCVIEESLRKLRRERERES